MKTVITLLSDLVKIMNDFLWFLFIENEENFELAVARQEETNKDKLTVIWQLIQSNLANPDTDEWKSLVRIKFSD